MVSGIHKVAFMYVRSGLIMFDPDADVVRNRKECMCSFGEKTRMSFSFVLLALLGHGPRILIYLNIGETCRATVPVKAVYCQLCGDRILTFL